jgi:hypothetical protein
MLGTLAKIQTEKFGMKSTTYMKKVAYDNKNRPVQSNWGMDETAVRNKIISIKERLFNENKNYVINFLYPEGWRSGPRFRGQHPEFYGRRANEYEQEITEDETSSLVFAFQIIEFP